MTIHRIGFGDLNRAHKMTILIARGETLEQDGAICPDPIDPDKSPDLSAEEAEIMGAIYEAALGLYEPMKTTFQLRLEGKFLREIAHETGVDIKAVVYRLGVASSEIRRTLDKRFNGRGNWRGAILLPLLPKPKPLPWVGFAKGAALAVAISITAAVALFLLIPWGSTEFPRSEVAAVVPAVPEQEPKKAAATPAPDKIQAPKVVPTPEPTAISISGRVLDPWGEPMDGIYVQAVRGMEKRYVLTGRDGRYRIPDLKPGKYTLEVRTEVDLGAEGWSKYWHEGGAVLTKRVVSAGAEAMLADLMTSYGSSATGLFIDQRTGQPASIPVFPHVGKGEKGYTEHFSGLKSRDGRFAMLFKEARPVRLAFKPVGCNFLRCEWQSIRLEPGPMRGLVFEFGRGGVIRGTVRHEKGRMLKTVRIVACNAKGKVIGGAFLKCKETERSLGYRIAGLPEAVIALKIYPSGLPAFRVVGIEAAPGIEVARDIIVRGGGELVLKVRDRRGEPVEFSVEVQSLETGELALAAHPRGDGLRYEEGEREGVRVALPSGHYKATVDIGGAKQVRVFEAESGKKTEMSIIIER